MVYVSQADGTEKFVEQSAPEPLVLVYYWGALMSGANGSQQRTLRQLSFICQQSENVVLYHYSNHPTDAWTAEQEAAFAARFPGVRLVSDTETVLLRILSKLKKFLILCAPSLAQKTLRLALPWRTPNYQNLRATHDAILYVVNYVDSLAQINGLEPENAIVETHDLRYFRRAKTSGTSLVSLKNLLALRYEIAAFETVKSLITISPNETYFYRNILPKADINYIPEYEMHALTETDGCEETKFDLLFAASGNHINISGICDLFAKQGEKLRDLRFAFCGLICDRPEIKELAQAFPNISLLHFLSAEELQRTYAQSKACLSPTHGTGLNIKLVDALRHGKPVFASEASKDGLTSGYEGCVFPLDPDLMQEVLSHPERLRSASEAAAAYYTRFSQRGDLSDLAKTLHQHGRRRRAAPA